MNKIVFWASDKSREHMLARAIGRSISRDGGEFMICRTADYGEERLHEGPVPGTDLALVFGVKGKSAEIIRDHRMLNIPILYLDKGISRQKGEGGHTEYTRIFINGGSPSSYMMTRKYQSDRFKQLGLEVGDRQKGGDYVLLLGSSQKYHEFHDLPPSQEYAEGVVRRLRKLTDQLIIYRPKPSDRAARPITGSAFSHGSTTFDEALRRASVVVTHGSSAAVFAILRGIPVVSLGDSITSPVAESVLENIADPYWADDKNRSRWAAALAYCQWTTKELRSGEAWDFLKGEVSRICG